MTDDRIIADRMTDDRMTDDHISDDHIINDRISDDCFLSPLWSSEALLSVFLHSKKKSSRELEQLVHFTSRLPPVSKVPASVTTFLKVRL